MGISRRFFTEHEAKRIAEIQDIARQQALFTRFWARKEAYVKCSGQGLFSDLKSFNVDYTLSTYHVLLEGKAATDLKAPPGFYAALVTGCKMDEVVEYL